MTVFGCIWLKNCKLKIMVGEAPPTKAIDVIQSHRRQSKKKTKKNEQKRKHSWFNDSVRYLDAHGRLPHPDELLPLQPRPEVPLQRDDATEDFPVEQRLQPLALGLAQEHLREGRSQAGSQGRTPARERRASPAFHRDIYGHTGWNSRIRPHHYVRYDPLITYTAIPSCLSHPVGPPDMEHSLHYMLLFIRKMLFAKITPNVNLTW